MNRRRPHFWEDVGFLCALVVLVFSLGAMLKAACWFMVAFVLLMVGCILWEFFRQ